MRQIVPPIVLTQKILEEPKPKEGASYRLTAHCVQIEQPEGVLLYHTLTGELLLLEKKEAEQLQKLSGAVPEALTGLIPHRVLVSRETNEIALADFVRGVAERFLGKDNVLTKYEIFTTTACNARCFYCFEAGAKTVTMTEETARAAGKYIAEHCGGKPVHIEWFGGEPLVNARVIDVITDYLRQQGVEFDSGITSNGYLFDASMVSRAKENWSTKRVQITLDGTEEIYNRRKAYVDPEGSPFQRVLQNISLLLDAEIPVVVRLNMDENNEKDLYTLVDELAERFGGRSGFGVYLRVLMENLGVEPPSYTEDVRCALAAKARALWEYFVRKGIAEKRTLRQRLTFYSCCADNVNAATITPEGRLGRCETTCERGIWGSVFSDVRDEAMLRQWRERRSPEELCRACAFYPRCTRLKECVARAEQCSPIEREEKRLRLYQAILETYEDWKAAGQS